jgi:hypothetical protein
MPTICFIIHGIGSQEEKFADVLQRSVHRCVYELMLKKTNKASQAEAVQADVYYQPIFWADIGSAEQNDLYRKIYPQLFTLQSPVTAIWQLWRHLAPARDLSINLIGDIFAYLGRFGEPIRRRVFAQIMATLEPYARRAEPVSVVVVGHSLGSVIVHDLLRSLMAHRVAGFDQLASRISLITMGSPISLFSLVRRPEGVAGFKSWINLMHRWDPVAFPVNPLHPGATDENVSTWRYWRQPSNWARALGPHTLYWTHPKVHDRIAEQIVAHQAANVPAPWPSLSGVEPPLEVFQPGNRLNAESGLIEYCSNFHEFQFGPLLSRARKVDICIVYGHTWINQNQAALVTALTHPDANIRVCITSPTSPALPALCHSFRGMKKEALVAKINDVGRLYREAMDEARRRSKAVGRLRLYHITNPPNFGSYRFDDRVYLTLRPTTGTKAAATPLPMSVYRPTEAGGMFEWMARDFDLLVGDKDEATLVFDSAAPQSNG